MRWHFRGNVFVIKGQETKTCVFPKLVQALSIDPSPLRIVEALFKATLQAT